MKLLTILFFITVSISTFAQEVKLKLASDVWPPFTNTPAPENKTVAFDLVSEALHRAKINFENDIVEFTDVMEGIKQDTYQGSAAVWKNEEREALMLFSAPYLQNQLVLVGLKGSHVRAKKLSELGNKKVAIVGSYAYGPEVEAASNVGFIKGENDQENLNKLLNKEVDYILVDDLLIQYLVNYHQKETAKYLEIGTMPLFTRSLHFAIRKDVPNAEHIIQQFNEEIVAMVAEGLYNRILELNWIQADVDGDGQLELVLAGDHAGAKAPSKGYSVYFNNSPTSTAVAANSQRYYINGKIYNDWKDVPTEYKVAPMKSESMEKFNILKFSF